LYKKLKNREEINQKASTVKIATGALILFSMDVEETGSERGEFEACLGT
jgi:hypothetical protein